MAGFLDSKERVIDLVLTEIGKGLLIRGELDMSYWVPFDDEVDYLPQTANLAAEQTSLQKRRDLTESPLVLEASSGYVGYNFRSEDLVNVNRPMFSAPPGTGQTSPLPRMVVDRPLGYIFDGTFVEVPVLDSVLDVVLPDASPLEFLPIQLNAVQRVVETGSAGEVTVDRHPTGEVVLSVDYTKGAFPPEYSCEGLLYTLYVSGTIVTSFHTLANEWLDSPNETTAGTIHGTFTLSDTTTVYWGQRDLFVTASLSPGTYNASNQTFGTDPTPGHVKKAFVPVAQDSRGFLEILPNRDSSGSIAYRNDLRTDNYTP